MSILYIVIAGVIIMSASLVGIITVQRTIGRAIEHRLPFLVSFSAGVFLFTAFFLAREALHVLDRGVVPVAALVVAGYVLAVLAGKVIPNFHHHHDADCHGHSLQGRRLLFGDAIHNIADGLILVPAFLVSPILGVGTAVSILIHETIQEIAEFFVLRNSGLSVSRALVLNLATSSTIFIGIGIGLAVSGTQLIQGVLLALSAGFFAQIIFADLLPHKHDRDLSPQSVGVHVGLLMLGVGVLALVNTVAAHSHTHDDHDSHAHDSYDTVVETDSTGHTDIATTTKEVPAELHDDHDQHDDHRH